MKSDTLGLVAKLTLILILLGLGFSCEAWKWSECRKVGHGKLYCAMKLGH